MPLRVTVLKIFKCARTHQAQKFTIQLHIKKKFSIPLTIKLMILNKLSFPFKCCWKSFSDIWVP